MLEAVTPTPADCGVTSIAPHTALILSQISNGGDVSMLVAQHKLYQASGQLRMGSGEIIGPERIAQIVAMLDESAARHASEQFLPARVIAHGADMIAWHVPGKRRPMFFATDAEGPVSMQVSWPSLLFLARGNRLWLAALDSDARPDADTPLYHAPLMNHDARNGLCFGNAERPARASLETMAIFETAVFKSNFSHCNGGNHLRYRHLNSDRQSACNSTHLAFYRSVEKRRLKRVPARHLLPLNKTVADFLKTGSNR